MQRVRVAADRWNFQLDDGSFISPLGGNMLNDQHPVDGTLFEHFDAEDCRRRFAAMAELGLNCLRQAIGVNQVFDPAAGLKSQGLKNWDTFIGLAEQFGIYLMPVGGYVGGNDWFDASRLADNGKALAESCRFWELFCGHYAGHPAIWAWDLRNELGYTAEHGSTDAGREAMILQDWPQYLQRKYGRLEVLNRLYGSAHASFTDVPAWLAFRESPFDPHACDVRLYLNERGYAWCKAQCDAIRAAAPGHMIVSGNNGWLFPDMDLWLSAGFQNNHVHDLFDFISIHPYPAPQCLPTGHGDPLSSDQAMAFWLAACVGMARVDHYGKPVVMQEFGWYGGGPSRFLADLPHRSEQEHADYTRQLIAHMRPHVNGFVNWPTMDMPAAKDISNHGGIFTHDGKPKALAAVYRDAAAHTRTRQQRARGTVTMTYSLLGLYTSRPYQDQMWEEITQIVRGGEVPDFRFV